MDSINTSGAMPGNILPSKSQSKEGENPVTQSDLAKLALMGASGNLRVGEKVTISLEGDKVTISKEGPDTWDRIKSAASDTARGAFRLARGVVEQDPSFAFRESLEVAKNSVERMTPTHLTEVIGKGLYPCMRVVLTAIDVHKAVKTTREGASTMLADKLVDYGHIATDVAGLAAIGGPLIPALARIPGSWTTYLAGAAIIGDIIAGAWHALRFTSQGLQRMKMEKEGINDQKPPVQPAPPAPTETKEAPKTK